MSIKRIFTDEEKEIMISMYKVGETYAEISKVIHIKPQKVSTYLKTLGYKTRPKNTLKNCEYLRASRKYQLNENFFESIDSQEKAYWLGFLYADGYVSKRNGKLSESKGGSIELTLKKEDTYHIANFLCDIECNCPILDKEIELNGNKYFASRVNINSIKIVNNLIKLGCTQNKSLTLIPPNLDFELIPHFIRGYFDGDGCVAFYPDYSKYSYSILGTYEILDYIRNMSGVPNNCIRSFEHKKCYELIITSKNDIEKFHNFIYTDKIIYLQRKYDKSLSMMKYCKLEDCRNETQKMADLLD